VSYTDEDDQVNVNLIDKKPAYLYGSRLTTVNILLFRRFNVSLFLLLTLIGLAAMGFAREKKKKKKFGSESEGRWHANLRIRARQGSRTQLNSFRP
jgi:hypothetical protein